MNIKPIRTKKDLTIALSRIDELIDVKHGTPEYDELEILSILVEVYEEKHSPIPHQIQLRQLNFVWIKWDLSRLILQSILAEKAGHQKFFHVNVH